MSVILCLSINPLHKATHRATTSQFFFDLQMLRQGNIRRSFNHITNSIKLSSSPSSSSPLIRTSMSTSTKFKPWPHPMVESHGDYRDEAYLEEHIGGKLYSQQKSLPRLPVPSISDTIAKLIPTALPLAKSEEETTTFIQACKEFEGQAIELHRRLVQRKEGEMKDSSWLQHWWNTMGYLQVRERGGSN